MNLLLVNLHGDLGDNVERLATANAERKSSIKSALDASDALGFNTKVRI